MSLSIMFIIYLSFVIDKSLFYFTLQNAAVFSVMRSQEPVTVPKTLLAPTVNSVYKEPMATTQSLAVRTASVNGLV